MGASNHASCQHRNLCYNCLMKSKQSRILLSVMFSLIFFMIAGCQLASPVLALQRPLTLSDDPNSLWKISKRELINRGFKIDRFDRRSEVIETYPLTSKQWFEFWRHDVVDDDSLAEASLQTIRRRVKLSLASTPSGQTQLDCQVTVQRLASHPDIDRRISRAKDIFASSKGRMPTLQSWADRKKYPQEWIPLGRDESLETEILRHIEKISQNHTNTKKNN